MGDIRLFISHSHDDKKIAAALVDVIEATMVPRERILCTSHDFPKYREPEGSVVIPMNAVYQHER